MAETTPPTDVPAAPDGTPAPERIEDLRIEQELQDSYLTYAMSTIMDRALPDVRDGLKPSQRRILVAMNDLGLGPRSKHRKCAKIAGDTSGNYHPRGEAVIYPALVRLAQDFNMRYPLVDGQGNFGSVDGDPPAAMRYTEARLAKISEDILADLEKETVDFIPNFDQTREEPVVLPSRIPNLLVNGASGIAVGMATNIPPHNLREIVDAAILLIEKPDATLKEVMKIVPGPDFPTGAYIAGREVRPGRKVRPWNNLHHLFQRRIGLFDQQNRSIHDFAQIVRRDVRGHTDGNATRPIDEQIRNARRQNHGLFARLIKVRNKIDGFFFQVGENVFGDLRQP